MQDDLYQALEAGQKVTAKVQWHSRAALDGRAQWIHCTPLISANGAIGVWMVILVDDDEEVAQAPKPQPVTSKTKPNGVPQPTPWEAEQDPSRSRSENGESPSTSNSSQTWFSESVRPMYEKVPPTVKEVSDSVPLPFATSRLRGSDSSVQTTESKPENMHPAPSWDKNDDLRRSTDEYARTRDLDVEEHLKPRQPARPRFGQPPDLTAFPIRPGPRISGKVYSYNSNSERGLFADDDRNTIASKGSDNRPTSQDSNMTAIRSQIPPTNLKWRKVDEQEGVLGRGSKAPIKLPGRPSMDTERPPVWKTKKSLSPYGVLFDE